MFAVEEVGGMSGQKLPQGASDINRHSVVAKHVIEEAVAIDRATEKMWEEVVDTHGDGCSKCSF